MAQRAAKRGDLIVIEKIERTYFLTVGWRERAWFEVYEVAGLFHDGRVRTVRSVAWSGAVEQQVEGKRAILGLVRTYLVPAARIDKAGAVEAVRAHTYPNSTTPMPFASLDDSASPAFIDPDRPLAAPAPAPSSNLA